MGVSHIASDTTWPHGAPIHEGVPATLYRLSDSLGRAWVVPGAREVPSSEVLAALADPSFDPSAEVILESASVSGGETRTGGPGPHFVALRDAPNRVTIRAILDRPGYLVVADTWYPGWQTTVNGQPAGLLRANYAFRAVWLEAGEHVVEMLYRPASVLWGGLVSVAVLLGLILVVASLSIGAHRRRTQ
jgi:hypothetical protein